MKNFLEKLVGEIGIPQDGDEMVRLSTESMGPIVEMAVCKNLSKIPIISLISYLKKADQYAPANGQYALLDSITNRLSHLNNEQIGALNHQDIFYLSLHPRCSEFHLLLRKAKNYKPWSDNDQMTFFHLGRADPEIRKSLRIYFEDAFSEFIGKADFKKLKDILKNTRYIEEYLPIIIARARVLLEDISLEDIRGMRMKYGGNFRGCRMSKILPAIEEGYSKKISLAMKTTQTPEKFIFESERQEIQITKEMLAHFSELLKNASTPEEIEGTFRNVVRERISDELQELVRLRYMEIIKICLKEQKSKLAWLWDRLLRSPFRVDALSLLDMPMRNALQKTDASSAWKIMCGRCGDESLDPYYRIAKRKYVMRITHRIGMEENTDKLKHWFEIGGKRTKGKILARLHQLWEPLSFIVLAVDYRSYATYSNSLLRDIQTLKETMLSEKLPSYLKRNLTPTEVLEAFDLSPLLRDKKVRVFKKSFKEFFNRMIRCELEEFKAYERIGDALVKLAENRIRFYVNRDIADESLDPLELLARAKKIPNIFRNVSVLLDNEANRRVTITNNIEVLEDLFQKGYAYWHVVSERYLQILSAFLESASENEIEKRYQRCPEKLKKVFINALLEIANAD